MIPVPLDLAIVAADQHEGPDVELAVVVEEGVRDVELQDHSLGIFPIATALAVHHSLLDFLEFIGTIYAVAPIGELPRLHHPAILVLILLPLLVVVLELLELGIHHTLGHMESQGQHFPDVAGSQLVVLPHAVEHPLLVPEQPIRRQVVVHYVPLVMLAHLHSFPMHPYPLAKAACEVLPGLLLLNGHDFVGIAPGQNLLQILLEVVCQLPAVDQYCSLLLNRRVGIPEPLQII